MKLTALREKFLSGQSPPLTWERKMPDAAALRRDVWVTVVVLFFALLAMEMMLSFASGENAPDRLTSYLAISALVAPLAVRRRFPIVSMLILSAFFIAFGTWLPAVMVQLAPQITYFVGLYTAVAWARDRKALRVALFGVLIAMFLWLLIGITNAKLFYGSELNLPTGAETSGVIDPVIAYAGYNFLVNIFYFGGAIYLGLSAWRSAWKNEVVIAQAAQLREQSAELARRAVIDERLRIARELHDVVAHHISAVGVQAAAARMVQPRDPQRAAELMRGIEDSARQAVGETRALLRVLRHEPDSSAADPQAHRSPEPGLRDIPTLVEQATRAGLKVQLIRVEYRDGFFDSLSAGLGLALYRIAAESLANVREHSTARSAVLSLRSGKDEAGEWAEVEVTDDGNPLTNTGGSGFGLRGIRERAELHKGLVEIGPRTPNGWRTRARLSVPSPTHLTPIESSTGVTP
ncbi:sensor histidine kinase [Arthrobacter sp. MYb227]|uniref:sensor histidine kinase n=1 Tax=Arthrobacter sp. MYb227 TaxID=1848601 RepID=UPI000CFDD648|nr:histidine kinase [Arthrobacter sp. MYb227]PQZ87011.1 sensor histidine kinase [Arthrobacter sp. MYb227]